MTSSRRSEGRSAARASAWRSAAFIIAGLYAIFSTACDPCARLSRRCPPKESVRDSVYIRDTVIRTVWQTDSSQIIALRRELERVRGMLDDTVRAETSVAVARAWADGETLCLELRNKDSARVEVPVYHEREESRHEEARTKETVKVVKEYRTRPLVAAAAWFGLAAALLWVGRGLLRMILRLRG